MTSRSGSATCSRPAATPAPPPAPRRSPRWRTSRASIDARRVHLAHAPVGGAETPRRQAARRPSGPRWPRSGASSARRPAARRRSSGSSCVATSRPRGGELQDRVHVWWHAQLRLPLAPDPRCSTPASTSASPASPCPGSRSRPSPPGATPRWSRSSTPRAAATACSRFDGAPDKEQQRAANRLRDVRHLAEVEAARARWRHAPDSRVLLVTYKAAEERLLAQGPIPGVDVVHFGALRGLDAYKDHATVIIAGRQQPLPGRRSRPWPAPCSATRTSPSP